MGKLLSTLSKKQKKGQSFVVENGKTRELTGVGYITLPIDISREAYIRSVFENGLLIIVTKDNQIIKSVRVPDHILNDIEFPTEVNQIGQEVAWINIAKMNQVILTGIIRSADSFYPYNNERAYVNEKKYKGFSITEIKDIGIAPMYSVVNSSDNGSDGEILFKASGPEIMDQSYLRLKVNGHSRVYGAKHVELLSEQLISIQIGTNEDEIGLLTIDVQGNLSYTDKHDNHFIINEQGVEIEGALIKSGKDATEQAALGNTLQEQLNKSKARIDLIINAIMNGQTNTSPDAGAAYKASMIGILQAAVDEDYSNILSDKNKVE